MSLDIFFWKHKLQIWLIVCVCHVLFKDIFLVKKLLNMKQCDTKLKFGYVLLFGVVTERDWLLQCGIGGRLLEQPILNSSSFSNISR